MIEINSDWAESDPSLQIKVALSLIISGILVSM